MATRAVDIARPEPRTLAEKLVHVTTKAPVHLALIAIAIFWLVPTVGLAVTSFRPRPEIAGSGWWTALTDWKFTLTNYDQVLSAAGMGTAFKNSLFITIPSTLLPLTIGAIAAFGFAWINFPLRNVLFLSIIGLMAVPVQTSLVPLLKLFRGDVWTWHVLDWSLNSSFVGIWLAHTAFGLPLAIFLLRNFFITLPKDLIEAARIDGASNLMVLRRVVLPVSVPALASYGIFQFLWVWNDLLMALIFVQDPNKRPMTVRISELQSTYGTEWHLLSSASFLLMVVPLIVFFALQRYFVQGLLAGSVKS